MNICGRKALLSVVGIAIYIMLLSIVQMTVFAEQGPVLELENVSIAASLPYITTYVPAGVAEERSSRYAKTPQVITPIIRENARDFLIDAAARYSGKLLPENILIGSLDEGPEHLYRPVTRVEAIVMIDRAFGQLPAPIGDLERSGAAVPYYNDIPDWADGAVENLAQAKVLLPTKDHMLNSNEILDESEYYQMIQRIYALLSYAPQDDFYRAINRDWLENVELFAGDSSASLFSELEMEIDRRIDGILKSILRNTWNKGTIERKITDIYNNILNMESRDQTGCDPIKPYLNAISVSNDLYALDKALYAVSRDLGIDIFFSFKLEPNIQNSTKYAVYLKCPSPTLPMYFAKDINSPQMTAFEQYAAALFRLADFGDPEFGAESVKQIEWRLANGQRDTAQPINYAEEYKKYSISKLKKLFPAADIVKLGAISGLRPEEAYYITDARLLGAFSYVYQEENIEAVKAYATFRLLDECSGILSQDFLDARFAFSNAILGTPETPDLEREARAKVVSLASAYFEEMYIEKHFSVAVKRDVEAMARILTDTLKARVLDLDWMSNDAKEAAIYKLDTLNIKVGMPNNWDSVLESVNIRGWEEGGTYFENITAYYRQYRALMAKKQGKAVDKDAWDLSVLTVNACYKSNSNEITIPAAMLQPPLYVYRGMKEENYGGIGVIIAHELIHVIDYHGEQFDSQGNAAHWWSDEDVANFVKICERVSAQYNGYEAAPGLGIDGNLTVMENIADLGMIVCAYDVIEAMPNPDYKLFFTKAAKIWATTSTREALDIFLHSDTHSSGNARVNKTFQNLDIFYKIFNIQKSDGMYIAPNKRLNIW